MLALPNLPCSARSRAVATHPSNARTHCRQVCRAAAQAPPVSAAAKQRRLGDSDLNISGAPVPQPRQPRCHCALSSRMHYSTVAYHIASLAPLADVLVVGPQCACMSVITQLDALPRCHVPDHVLRPARRGHSWHNDLRSAGELIILFAKHAFCPYTPG